MRTSTINFSDDLILRIKDAGFRGISGIGKHSIVIPTDFDVWRISNTRYNSNIPGLIELGLIIRETLSKFDCQIYGGRLASIVAMSDLYVFSQESIIIFKMMMGDYLADFTYRKVEDAYEYCFINDLERGINTIPENLL